MTTRCTIKFFGGLRQKSGGAEKEASGNTIREALELVCVGNDELRTAIFEGVEGVELLPHVRVMINGRDSELADGLETAVTNNDQIAIFPPIAGG